MLFMISYSTLTVPVRPPTRDTRTRTGRDGVFSSAAVGPAKLN